MMDTFKDAESLGPFDEYLVLVAGIDSQLHLSRKRPSGSAVRAGQVA